MKKALFLLLNTVIIFAAAACNSTDVINRFMGISVTEIPDVIPPFSDLDKNAWYY